MMATVAQSWGTSSNRTADPGCTITTWACASAAEVLVLISQNNNCIASALKPQQSCSAFPAPPHRKQNETQGLTLTEPGQLCDYAD